MWLEVDLFRILVVAFRKFFGGETSVFDVIIQEHLKGHALYSGPGQK